MRAASARDMGWWEEALSFGLAEVEMTVKLFREMLKADGHLGLGPRVESGCRCKWGAWGFILMMLNSLRAD